MTDNQDLEASKEGQKRLSVDIPLSLHKAIKIRCADEERDMREIVIEKLTEYVNSPHNNGKT